MNALAALLVLLAQEESPEVRLLKRCDSQIPWLTDGTELVDMELLPGHHPVHQEGRKIPNFQKDRAALLEEAKKQAAQSKRLILWYCPRVAGSHMYRAWLLDTYARVVFFTDPDVVDLVREHFVPLRMCSDEATGAAFGLKPFDFIEPALLVITADGKIIYRLDHVRTFNAEWLRSVLFAALQKFGTRSLSPPHAFRRDRLYREALADYWSGKDPGPRLRELVEKHPESPYAWKAAANFVRAEDGVPLGPLVGGFEDASWSGEPGLPSSTRLPAKDVGSAARGAVRFLLGAQRPHGGWDDARYAYWTTPKILPNVRMAVTAAAALALGEWRDVDARVPEAVARAERYLLDESRMARGENEECYADAFRLRYFARKRDVPRMNAVVARLAAQQDKEGWWAHEYPNPFSTAAVVNALGAARRAGADVPEVLFRKAADVLQKTRGADGRQAYNAQQGPDSEKNSMSRTALCELALQECGRGSVRNVAAGVAAYWKFIDRLEAVRLCDYHSDGRLGGFFYFHAAFHTIEAVGALEESGRKEHRDRFRDRILAIPEFDGSFLDSHELGKSYGTAMALLVLRRASP